MSFNLPQKAFILGAGMGTRLRPMTDSTPKPLVKVAGKPIIEYVLDELNKAGVTDVTVNTYYLAALIETYLERYTTPQIHISREEDLLNTGGGIKKAIANFGDEPFFVVSGDSFWTNGSENALHKMAKIWDPEKMDILLLLQPLSRMTLTQGVGDYDINENGTITRSQDQSGSHMWTSIRICKPEIFADAPEGAFSFLELLDHTESAGRLYGIEHDGEWHHISTPEDHEITEEYLQANKRVA